MVEFLILSSIMYAALFPYVVITGLQFFLHPIVRTK